VDVARPLFEAALGGLTRDEAATLVRGHGGSSVPFNAPREVLAHDQARGLGVAVGTLPWRVLAGDAEPGLSAPAAGEGQVLPLDGIRVVDFGVGGVAPFAGVLLAALGADVVKVEAPNEFIHAVRPHADGVATTYSALNAGKRSADLNLKDPGDAAKALALVREADVVLENFRPRAMDRLGFGYAALAEDNPGLVYLSAQGFGSTGALSGLQCTDPHIQAFAGWALANAGRTGVPRRTRYYAMLDLVTSMVIVEAALAALVQRTRTDRGGNVEVSMLEAVVSAHVSRWAGLADGAGAWSCERLYAPDGLFPTADGAIALSVEDDVQWSALVRALGAPAALLVAEWRMNAGRLEAELELEDALGAILSERSSQGWLATLSGSGVAAARVTGDDDAALRRDLWARDYLRRLPRRGLQPLRAGGPPWAFEPPLPTLSAPQPGGDAPRFETPDPVEA
jgi:CoA:oxalate CoA-transferase